MLNSDEVQIYVPTLKHSHVVLGFLDEYVGRRIVQNGNQIERFYPNETKAADCFEAYLRSLQAELGLESVIDRKSDASGFITFHLTELNEYINSFYGRDFCYDRKISYPASCTEEHFDIRVISAAAFQPIKRWGLNEEYDSRFSYLLGAYGRYGNGNQYRFANATHKAEMVAKLLREVHCNCVTWKTRQDCIPVVNEIEFTPTKELESLFARNPQNENATAR